LRRTRGWRSAVLLCVCAVAGLTAAFGATAAPTKKPPKTTTITTTDTTTTTVPTTVTATTTTTDDPPAPAPTADLSDSMLDPSETGYVGETLTYTNVVRNDGGNTATGVHLEADVLRGGTVVGAAASSGSCAGTTHVTCSLGSLPSGASAVVDVRVALSGPGRLVVAATGGADQPDPQAANNTSRASTLVYAGHAGAPGIATSVGAFAPPLVGHPHGHARIVDTSVRIDEPATVYISVVARSGDPVTLLAGSRVNYVPSNRPHTALPIVLEAARSIPLHLRLPVSAGGSYSILVRAVGPNGEASTARIGFGS
jgi:uncharacterized repeat protein (TIGR01451 family)